MSFNMKDMTQGGQILYMRLRMFGQIMSIMVWWLIMEFLLITAGFLYLRMSSQNFVNGFKYWWCVATEYVSNMTVNTHVYSIQYYGATLKYTSQQVLTDAYTVYCGQLFRQEFVLAITVSGIVVGITSMVAIWVLGRQGKQQSEDEITGGRTLTDDPKAVTKLLKSKGRASNIVFEKLALVKDSEVQNFGIHGTVGSGKSRAFRTLMEHARKRGDLAVVYDKAGTFVEEFYDASTDHILNPLDERCANWDLWSEFSTIPEFDNYANFLIPMGPNDDPFWQGSARTIFANASHKMRKDKDRSYWRLLDTLLSIKLDKLRSFLTGTPAANLVASEIEKTAVSIRGVLTNYVKAIRYLVGIEKPGPKFTIREWMRDVKDEGEKNGWLFITSDELNHDSLTPVLSAWLGISIKSLMSMKPNRDRRVWFFFDELPTLQKLAGLVSSSAEARKFGGCFVMGIQSYAQLEEIYGVKNAAAMFDTLNTRFFFRNPSHQISDWVAKELGEKERNKATEQFSYGADSVRDGVSVGKDEDRTQLVSYSDIQSLDNLQCYVTLPGPYPVVKVTMKYKSFPQVADPFILREIDYDQMESLNKRLAELEAENAAIEALFADDKTTSGENTNAAAAPKPTPSSLAKSASTTPPPTSSVTNRTGKPTSNKPATTTSGGGREQEIPPGVTEFGEIVDMSAYEQYANEQDSNIDQKKIARREEQNINHSQSQRDVSDGFEPGGHF